MWQLRRAGESVVYEGRSFFWHIVFALLLVPVVYGVCGYCQASTNLQFGLTLFPLFYAGGMAVGILVVMRVPRLEFQTNLQQIVLQSGQIIPYSDVVAIQFVERFTEYDEECFVYQVNLCFQERGAVRRLCLTQTGIEESAVQLALQLSERLHVRIDEHYLSRKIIERWDKNEGQSVLKKAMVLVSALAAIIVVPTVIWSWARQPVWIWSDPHWFGVFFPIAFLVLAIALDAQQKNERDRHLRRSPTPNDQGRMTNDQ